MSGWGDFTSSLISKFMDGNEGNLLQIAEQALGQQGGVQGLLASLSGGGLGEQVTSWLSTGSNLPVSADQISAALNSDQLSKLAAAVGIDASSLPDMLAKILPAAIDRASPDGTLQH